MRTTILTVVLTIAMTLTTAAETEIDFSGQIRVRPEIDGRSFAPDAKTLQYTYLRTRAALKALIDDNTDVYIQIQDSRSFGDLTLNDEPSSGTLNNTQNVDLHQGYIAVRRMFLDGLGMKAGRFEFNLGNQRVFGAVGWSNVGRSWDGVQFWYESDDVTFLPFWLKRIEVNADDGNRDFDIYGANVTIKQADLEILGVYEHNGDGTTIGGKFVNYLDRFSAGIYFARDFNPADLTVNAVLQTGNIVNGSTEAERDISAFLLTAEVGYAFEDSPVSRVAVGVDYASGDDDLSDDDWKAYDNLYYTGHKFRGYMDYFVSYDLLPHIQYSGLVDIMGRLAMDPAPDWSLTLDAHYFRTAADYYIPGSLLETSKSVGMEADLTVLTKAVAGVSLQGGASVFFASDDLTGDPDSDPGFWLYGMVTADF
jgi:hypothetical protein